MTKTRITLPGYLYDLSSAEQRALEELMRHFGNAQRRAYRLKQQQVSKAKIEKILQQDHPSVQGKSRQARRKIRQILGYKLQLRSTPVKERSEAYTCIGGKKLSSLIGLDTHKCAAMLFALKVTNYPLFQALVKALTQGSFDDGCGSLRKRSGSGMVRGLTALCQNGRVPARMKF
ncbi:MAG: hypothetical protein ACFFDI_18050 [Promethearchaeota archaeon]